MRLSAFAILAVLLLATAACAFEVLTPPPKNPNRDPNTEKPKDLLDYVNPIKRRILPGKVQVHVRRFAQIPPFRNKASRIVGLVSHAPFLYATTSTSGGRIYRISTKGNVRLWFNLASRLYKETGRRLNCTSSQHGGLRGIAFPPDFDTTGLFYTSYMEDRPKQPWRFKYVSSPRKTVFPDSVVAEWRYSHKRRTVIWGSYRSVLRVGMTVLDHPIKQIAFDGDDLLIGHGDGSKQSAVGGGGLRNDALGKVLRINPRKFKRKQYTIPRSNPFVGQARYRNEIYAVGFRNPHNICVSKKLGIFVADAGRDNSEEINIIKKGGNYGWPKREGTFLHLAKGGTGLGIGVKSLPKNDSLFNFIYPNVEVGHLAPPGKAYFGQAIAGSCPIENGSPLSGLFFYANFPEGGQLYYSWVGEMQNAVTKGAPRKLRTARVYQAKIWFDHDGVKKTAPKVLADLREVVRADGKPKARRVDMRFGRGPRGELYWTSKTNGRIYLITSSMPGAKK